MKPKVCEFALSHLNHQLHYSKVSACYRCTKEYGLFTQKKISELINSEQAKEHRKTLMKGEWPDACGSCKDLESVNLTSTRLSSHGYHYQNPIRNYNYETGEISHIQSLELRFNNFCNLICRHCTNTHSSRWEKLIKQKPEILEKLSRENEETSGKPIDGYFDDILDNHIPKLERLTITGGEPLFQLEHYIFLQKIKEEYAKNINLLYVTNGTVTEAHGYDLIKIWKKFKSVHLIVSTDGVGEQFNYFREGANWDIVEKNILFWKDKRIPVAFEITCSAYQLFYLVETIDYLYNLNIAYKIQTQIVQYPPVINPRIIPQKAKMEILQDWNHYTSRISNNKKLEYIKRIGQPMIDYMLGTDLDAYKLPNKKTPTWESFKEYTLTLDKEFNREIKKSFPKLFKYF